MLRVAGAFILTAAFMCCGCESETGNAGPAKKDPPTSFAADREDESDGRPVAGFDGKRAMGYLEEICKIGPRISGAAGMRKQQELIIKHFKALGATVQKQTFEAKQRSQRNAVSMTNLIVSWHPERTRRVILCSHYDTRPIADQEHPRKWREPFVSANDGGSGVALLMELGNHMKDLKTNVGVDFVFFDGEEYIFDPRPEGDLYFFGSKHFAQMYKKNRPKHRYIAAILFDMIAGPNPQFLAEGHSFLKAGPLVTQIWRIAAEQNCTAFVDRVGPDVMDDHLALNGAGIPAIDIVPPPLRDGWSYKHWHRLTDVPENCSRAGLEQVARVMTVWLQRVK
jgi:hypothetical protein